MIDPVAGEATTGFNPESLWSGIGGLRGHLDRNYFCHPGPEPIDDVHIEKARDYVKQIRRDIPKDAGAIPGITEGQVANIKKIDSTLSWIWTCVTKRANNGRYKIPRSLVDDLGKCNSRLSEMVNEQRMKRLEKSKKELFARMS